MEFNHLESIFNDSLPGGHFKPNRCESRAKIAIIIPYRDRKLHLIHYLYNVIPKLQRQQLEFTIFVVEQVGFLKISNHLFPFFHLPQNNVGYQVNMWHGFIESVQQTPTVVYIAINS